MSRDSDDVGTAYAWDRGAIAQAAMQLAKNNEHV